MDRSKKGKICSVYLRPNFEKHTAMESVMMMIMMAIIIIIRIISKF